MVSTQRAVPDTFALSNRLMSANAYFSLIVGWSIPCSPRGFRSLVSRNSSLFSFVCCPMRDFQKLPELTVWSLPWATKYKST